MMILLTTLLILSSSLTAFKLSRSCPPEQLVVYKLELETFWDEKIFTKQYPQWRPSAQWSKTIGYSHPSSVGMFSLGSTVDEGVRQFVEKGQTDIIDQQALNKTFLDVIMSPPITKGVGTSSTNIFLDGNNTKVSLITKIVPSPDWFIGLDSLDLCQDGNFIETVKKEVFPLDGGTDNGFTFTSPNWETIPRAEVFTITNTFPSHPASSFFYPDLEKLPTLAVFSFTKLREYTLEKQLTPLVVKLEKEDKYKYDVIGLGESESKSDDIFDFVPISSQTSNKVNMNIKTEIVTIKPINKRQLKQVTDLAVNIPTEKSKVHNKHRRKVGLSGSSSLKGFRNSLGYHSSTSPNNFLKKKYKSPLLSLAQSKIFSQSKSNQLQSNTRSKSFQNMLASFGKSSLGTKRKKKRKLRRRKHRKHKKPRNCVVSEWGVWGPCSKSCGIGESLRKRGVKHHPKYGGIPCPPLEDFKWCGSAKNCNSGYFKW